MTESIRQKLTENMTLLGDVQKPANVWRSALNLPSTHSGSQRSALATLLHPEVSLHQLAQTFSEFRHLCQEDPQFLERLEIEAMYRNDIVLQLKEIAAVKRDEQMVLPDNIDYFNINVSNDAQNKLAAARPVSIAAASRIPGITPAAIARLLGHVKNMHRQSRVDPH